MIFCKTNAQLGGHVSVTPANSTNKHLAYGPIILNPSKPSVSFSTGDRETGLVCLSGEAIVEIGPETVASGQYDAIYIPRDGSVEVTSPSDCDIA